MSIFAPTDVLTPIERRKALVQKLMGQYSQSAQASQQTAMPGVAGQSSAAGVGVGSPFHGGSGLIGPRTAVTNINALSDIAPNVRANLGPGGFHIPLPLEASGSAGAPVDAPGIGMVNAPGQPGSAGGHPVGASGGAPVGAPVGAAPTPVGGASNGGSNGFTPLGGGLYFDPTTQTIQQVGGQNPQQVMGQAARDLANGNAPVIPGRTAIAY